MPNDATMRPVCLRSDGAAVRVPLEWAPVHVPARRGPVPDIAGDIKGKFRHDGRAAPRGRAAPCRE